MLKAALDKHRKNKRPSLGPWVITITLVAALITSYYHWNRYQEQSTIYNQITTQQYKAPAVPTNIRELILANLKEGETQDIFQDINLLEKRLKKIRPQTDSIYWYLAHLGFQQRNMATTKSMVRKIKETQLQQPLKSFIDKIEGR